MLFMLFLLLLIVIIFAREIKFIIGVLLLYAISLALWEYLWGKILILTFFLLLTLTLIRKIVEKHNNSPLNKHNDEEILREKAYQYGIEYWAKRNSDQATIGIENYRAWKNDPNSQPEIEKWFQENKHTF